MDLSCILCDKTFNGIDSLYKHRQTHYPSRDTAESKKLTLKSLDAKVVSPNETGFIDNDVKYGSPCSSISVKWITWIEEGSVAGGGNPADAQIEKAFTAKNEFVKSS